MTILSLPKTHLCQKTETVSSPKWKLNPSLRKHTYSPANQPLQEHELAHYGGDTEIMKQEFAKSSLGWVSSLIEKLSDTRGQNEIFPCYFSLLFALNRSRCSQPHMHEYSAWTAIMTYKSRGFRGRLWRHNVLQARDAYWKRRRVALGKR